MKISKNINTCILTDNNLNILKIFPNISIINDLNELKTNMETFVILNDVIRNLKKKDKIKYYNMLKKDNRHYINITSDVEEALYADYVIIYSNDRIILEGSPLSVFKEEKIIKRLGFKIPFMIDLSLQLNHYELIDSIYTDEKKLGDTLW